MNLKKHYLAEQINDFNFASQGQTVFKVQLRSDTANTKWLNITHEQLVKIASTIVDPDKVTVTEEV